MLVNRIQRSFRKWSTNSNFLVIYSLYIVTYLILIMLSNSAGYARSNCTFSSAERWCFKEIEEIKDESGTPLENNNSKLKIRTSDVEQLPDEYDQPIKDKANEKPPQKAQEIKPASKPASSPTPKKKGGFWSKFGFGKKNKEPTPEPSPEREEIPDKESEKSEEETEELENSEDEENNKKNISEGSKEEEESEKEEEEEEEEEERAGTLKCLILYDDYLKECNWILTINILYYWYKKSLIVKKYSLLFLYI